MVFSDALEVAIGLTFVFLLVSLAMTAVVEFIESLRRTRGVGLLEGIVEMLGQKEGPAARIKAEGGDEALYAAARALYDHPLLHGLFIGDFKTARTGRRLPSYIPSRSFALALIDQVLDGKIHPAHTTSVASLPAQAPLGERLLLAAERIDNERLRRAVMLAVQVGGNDLERVAGHIEQWFDSAMERVGGRFKRKSQHLLFWLGLASALLLNVNTLTIAESLTKDASLRRAVVAQVEATPPQALMPQAAPAPQSDGAASAALPPGPAAAARDARQALDNLDQLGLPLGWSPSAQRALLHPLGLRDGHPTNALAGTLQIILGYLITALAVSLGAPFWFDVLNRLMVIRSTLKPGEKNRQSGRASASTDEPGTPPMPGGGGVPHPLGGALTAAAAPIDRDIYAVAPSAADKTYEEWH